MKAARATSAATRHGHELAARPAMPVTAPTDPTPADPAEPIGAPGTLNMWGFITGEDYNPDLDGFTMFPFYDKMRRGDAQVSASLQQIKLPLKAAKKLIKPASDDPQDQAIADATREALLTDRALARPFEDVFDHALLRFDFGCSASEIVWEVGEAGELRYRDLPPRLPRTFYRWVEWEAGRQAGELRYLEQYAPKAGRYGYWQIPTERLLRHTHRREGNNYYGISILRPAYPHWYWKQQLYRIGAVQQDRFGAGIFIAKLNEKWTAANAPLAKLEDILKGLRVHEQGYAISPFGVDLDILSSRGGEGQTQGLIALVEHHNQQIAANVLQQFSTQGQQKHGSFGGAKVTFDAFLQALEGQAQELATEFTLGLVRPFCDANFDMTGRPYPQFTCGSLGSVDVSALIEDLAKAADKKLITPDDEMEEWLRDQVDAPAMPDDIKGRSRISVPPTFPGGPTPPAPADPSAPPQPVPADTGTKKPVSLARFLEADRTFARQPTKFERHVFELHAIPARLDDERDRLARELSAIRLEQLKAVAKRIAQKDARKTGAFTDIRRAHITMPRVTDMVKTIKASQSRVLEYGAAQVRAELGRQGLELANTAGTNRRTAKSALVSSAEITADQLSDTWLARIMDEALRRRRTGLQGDDLEAAVVEALQGETDSGLARASNGEVNEAFGVGRATEIQAQKGQIESAQYSCVLDAASCDVCANLDGDSFDVDSSEYEAALPPNKDCEGRDNCRCVMLVIAKSAQGGE